MNVRKHFMRGQRGAGPSHPRDQSPVTVSLRPKGQWRTPRETMAPSADKINVSAAAQRYGKEKIKKRGKTCLVNFI